MYKMDARARACGALNNLKEYGINRTSKMRWENEGANDCRLPDWIYARYKIYEAFGSGFISWNIFNLALNKTEAASNGSWMFENNFKYNNETVASLNEENIVELNGLIEKMKITI